jgi:hypothetical protein
MSGRFLLALLAAALVFSAAPAQAKKLTKLTQATATSSATGAFNVATATATCPAGKKAVAGGYATSPPNIPNHWLNVYESQRVGQTSWRVSGVEYFPAPATDFLVAYVYCEALRAKVKAATASLPLTPTLHDTSSVLALCPAGTKALSGGFVTPASNAVDASYVSRSTAAGSAGWVVDTTNLNGTAARTVFGFVYCAKVRKPKQQSADIAVLGPTNAIRTASTPACPKRTTARGGGFATSTPVGGLQATALVYETRRVGASWISSASASSNSTSSTLVSTALCR